MNDCCLYDNPKTMRREYWRNGVEGYSICAFVTITKRVPTEFADEWKATFEFSKVQGDASHIPSHVRQ